MAASNAYIFSTLAKFSDGDGTDLNAFLARFDRCCVVANKVDADVPVKGQLLMLFVEGRARAALEEFELTQGGQQQTYAALVAKLKEYFDSTAARETSNKLFESRTKKLNETEEEFMLQLLRLYKTANPDHAEAVTLLAIKRKFLAGISPTLRGKIFIFCEDPYAEAVTREGLLSHCRKARNLLSTPADDVNPPPTTDPPIDRVLATGSIEGTEGGAEGGTAEGDEGLITAINNLSRQVQQIQTRVQNFENGDAIATLGGGQRNNNNYRGRGRGNNHPQRGNFINNRNRYGNRGGSNGSGGNNRGNNSNRGGSGNRGGFRGGFRGGYNNRGGNNNGNNDTRRCFNCTGIGHVARNCPSYQAEN